MEKVSIYESVRRVESEITRGLLLCIHCNASSLTSLSKYVKSA